MRDREISKLWRAARRYCTLRCGGGKSSPFRNEVIFPARSDSQSDGDGEYLSYCNKVPAVPLIILGTVTETKLLFEPHLHIGNSNGNN